MSSSLGHLQNLFSRALPADSRADIREAFFSVIEPAKALSAADALAVYRSNGTGALLKSLEGVFPVCQQILGEACFHALAKAFIHTSPCVCRDLNGYGEEWPDFLTQKVRYEPTLADFAYLPDLARLEWAWHEIYFAADGQNFDFDAFQTLCASADDQTVRGVRFCLHPALITLCSDYPVLEIWSRHVAGEACAMVDPIDAPQAIIVHRAGKERRAEAIDHSTHSLLIACAARKSLGQILDTNAGAGSAPIMDRLPLVLGRGWIVGFEAPAVAPGRYSDAHDV